MAAEKEHAIGELNEQPLHAALKSWYAEPGDELEKSLDGYVVDIFRGGKIIEIQTGNFSSLKKKLGELIRDYPLTLVYPVAAEKWLYKLPKPSWEEARRRKSPRRGRVEEVFNELVSFPHLLAEPHFSLEIVLIQEEEVRRFTGRKMWWNNGWERVERRLLEVLERVHINGPQQLGALLPTGLDGEFTTADLARTMDCSRRLAQKMAYCLRKTGEIQQVGKRGRALVYQRP